MNIKKTFRAMGKIAFEAVSPVSKRLSSNDLQVTHYTFQDKRWMGEKSLRFALVSDFHGGDFHWQGKKLAQWIKNEQVDFICVSGDHFEPGMDHHEAFAFFEAVVEELPVYYASGNHDEGVYNFEAIKEILRNIGVHVLENSASQIEVHGQFVEIFGVRDRSVYTSREQWIKTVQPRFDQHAVSQAYRLVICHQPEVKLLDRLDCSVALSGHAHGGQWRTPTGQGIFAPGQGVFPKYTRGVYERNGYRLIVGTGFKVNYLVPRINNNPELVIVEIGK